jgi:hydrogenase nickel incorporation protein HypA/HybF
VCPTTKKARAQAVHFRAAMRTVAERRGLEAGMHELAVTESIVEGITARVEGARVTRVILEIGTLSGISAESIRFYFDTCALGTPLEGARLEVRDVPGRARCRSCAAEADVRDLLTSCACGAPMVDLISGTQLIVKAVEVN